MNENMARLTSVRAPMTKPIMTCSIWIFWNCFPRISISMTTRNALNRNVSIPMDIGVKKLMVAGMHEIGVVPMPALLDIAMPMDMMKRPIPRRQYLFTS